MLEGLWVININFVLYFWSAPKFEVIESEKMLVLNHQVIDGLLVVFWPVIDACKIEFTEKSI